jgi:hypothetical protein
MLLSFIMVTSVQVMCLFLTVVYAFEFSLLHNDLFCQEFCDSKYSEKNIIKNSSGEGGFRPFEKVYGLFENMGQNCHTPTSHLSFFQCRFH